MKYYIAYGSNINEGQMAYRCPDAKVACKATLKGWKLVFRKHATIERVEGCEVPVLIWTISDRDERNLDRYEGFPKYYVKELFDVRVGRKNVTAMAYIMTDGRVVEPPTRMYYDVIMEGYLRFGLDTAVLRNALLESVE